MDVLHMGIDDWIVFVVIGGAVDVADAVEFVVEAELLSSECRLRELHTMEGSVFAVGDINKGRSAFGLESDRHLISKLLAVQMLELRQEAGGSPAVEATAIHVGGAVSSSHTDQEFLDRDCS